MGKESPVNNNFLTQGVICSIIKYIAEEFDDFRKGIKRWGCNESSKLLETVVDKLVLSARAYTRILKVARTIADLENSENIRSYYLSEAIQYRSLDRWQ